ncbi:PTS system mannose/fructose/N-acetylgalactosamine-transporter subunit IIB [Liquorilactobacillus capillatus]|uniref:PTS system mannose/fructose/N-acetylgalactosamine-transporter subunit IIB n=1 Tax=Liquorilactobacillus capillatus TaxID=480931 RepID=UPI00070EE54D|nr:mannose/fructose/sorbose PTS transporter subunit IIB [Liquorilactobacillus capillatus]
MKITVARIDDRYIHGQVLTKWIKLLPAERIIVVSDEVAEDPMRKTLVLSVAPSNVRANAVTPEKMGRVFKNPKYAGTTAMLLFGNPAEIVEAIENGVEIKTVNVGGMRFDPSKKQITESVSVTPEDVKAFEKLSTMGVKLELRQLPGDSSQDFAKLLKQKL